MALSEFLLCPLLDSYNPTTPSGVISTQADAGMPRQRLDIHHPPHSTQVSFVARGNSAQYIKSFWRAHRMKAFKMRLILDDEELAWYECRWLGNPSFNYLGKGVIRWSCNIVVKPKAIDIETDKAFVYLYNETNGNPEAYMNLMDVLVNEKLPDAMTYFTGENNA